MVTPLLTTKLYVPPGRPGLVSRPRLMERLRGGLSCGLVLVSAPAGFGKTTLVSEWLRQSKDQIRTAWVSLDEGDNDPVRFWDYFIAALRTIQPNTGETALALLHAPETYPAESVLTALINDLSAIPDDFAVVLDDYHLITAESIHAGIAFLLDHLPPKMHLIIATRADPSLPLSRFRGRGTLLEISSDDLRFTIDETADLLKKLQDMELTAEQVSALNAQTEGWAVGLKMAALSMREQKDVRKFIATFSGSQRYITDYLVEEVLKRQPKQIRDFLLKTSVLERLAGPLCDAVTGRNGSKNMLTKLEQANLFLIPLDESRQWYRYHYLFAELLRHQLEVKYGAKEVTRLHGQASQWYEDNKFQDDAIHHALIARDWERAMRLIYDPDEKLIKLGEHATLLTWLKAVPEEALRTHHQLYRQFAYLLLMSEHNSEAAQQVLSYLETAAPNDGNLQGEIALLRANIAQAKNDLQNAIDLSKKALLLLAPDNLTARGRATSQVGVNKSEQGLIDEAEPLLAEAAETAQKAGDKATAAVALNFLSRRLLFGRGELHRAADLLQQAIELGSYSQVSGAPRLSLGYLLYEWNELEEAAQQYQRVIEFCQSESTLGYLVLAYFFLAHTRLSQGDVAEATAAMERADALIRHPGVARGTLARHAAFRFTFANRQEDAPGVLHWGNRVLEYADAMPLFAWHIPARVLIARGKNIDAAEQLQSVYDRTVQQHLGRVSLKVRVCQTLASATGAEATIFLADALKMGQPEGYIRTFVDEGKLLEPLLRQALAQGVLSDYTGKLISIIEAEERQRRARGGATAISQPSESKTELPTEKTAVGGSNFLETIQAMVNTMEAKDPYTAVHQRQVTALAEAIAAEMGLPEQTREAITLAAMVHDIGKISVPLDILNKPGKLTAHELDLIKDHPTTGYEILKKVTFPYPIAEIVYQHHERLDGSGNPRGLKGGEICLEARVIAVADVVESMAVNRPYRASPGLDKALEQITRDKGTGLDSDVVEACLELFREKSFKFE